MYLTMEGNKMSLLNGVMKAGGHYWAVKLALMVEAANEGTTVFRTENSSGENIVINRKGNTVTVSDIGITEEVTVDFIIKVSRVIYRRYLRDMLNQRLHERGGIVIADILGRYVPVDAVGSRWKQKAMVNDEIVSYTNIDKFENILFNAANENALSKFKHVLIYKIIQNGIYNDSEFTDRLFPSWYEVEEYADLEINEPDGSNYFPWDDKILVKNKKYTRYDLAGQLELYAEGRIDYTPLDDDEIDELFASVTSSIDGEDDVLKALYISCINIARSEIRNSLSNQERLIEYHKCEISRRGLLALDVSKIKEVESFDNFDNTEKDGNDQ